MERMLRTEQRVVRRKIVTKSIEFHFPELSSIPNESPGSKLEFSKVPNTKKQVSVEQGSEPENEEPDQTEWLCTRKLRARLQSSKEAANRTPVNQK